ncbi:alpha/beta hydrolase family protein [Bacteroides coprosuis]|uniref:alpha/beta hydrolase family protein n=1 Tax=Bacteroides coprosuis TaxID=151276 RepID=UPI001D6E394B|nr:alpha/beta fold hydrolase [Bacteroides coprosuis]HJD91826.1 alpha/beta fold hydrolase [Bacteroides coprosuis]
MKKLLLILTVLISIPCLGQNLEGSWKGIIEIQGTKLNLVFNFKEAGGNWSATMDSPDQGGFGIPMDEVTINQNKVLVKSKALQLTYEGTITKDCIEGIFQQSFLQVPLNLKSDTSEASQRPQEPQPPFPYQIENISFPSLDKSITLSGTLTLPDDLKKHPAVVLIAGSGPANRDEEIFGHKPFAVIADYLTRQGLAVLRYDKRGIGESTGSLREATTLNLAEDVEASIQFLRNHPNIQSNNIGLIGHSEGGIIAPMVASRDQAISFIVLLAAPGMTGKQILKKQNEESIQRSPITNDQKTKALNVAVQYLDYLAQTSSEGTSTEALHNTLDSIISINLAEDIFPQVSREEMIKSTNNNWIIYFLNLDPSEYLKKVHCPILALNGTKDIQVEANSNLKIIESSVKNKELLTVKKYLNLNHLFQKAETGAINEYAQIQETFSEDVLRDILTWISRYIKF